MDALKIQTAVVAGFDWGARTADVMATLWPERCKGIVSVGGYLISSPAGNQVPLPSGACVPVLVPVLFRHPGREGRLCEIPRPVQQVHLAPGFTKVEFRRCHVQPLRSVLPQPRPR